MDPLGRAFLSIEDNGATAGTFETRSALDIQGNALSIRDARGNLALQQTLGLEQHPLHSFSADAGDRFVLPDVAGTFARSFDGRGFAIRTVYDRLRRPSHLYVTPPGGAEFLAERLAYGEAAPGGGVADNLRGRKVLHYDGAGELFQSSYDFKGNATTATRRLALAFQTTPDWSALAALSAVADLQAGAEPLLEPELPLATNRFTVVTAFDALNRPTAITTPDASVVMPTYNEANRLERLDVYLRGAGAATPFVTNLDYNARGQRIRADHPNGTSTSYAYDPLTFLLVEQITTRASDGRRLQDFTPTYDPVHNIVAIDDSADASLFFRGAAPVAGGGQYEYDAVYRLTRATGREHPGQQMADQNDSPFAALPHPNDTQALRAYIETYQYDPAGNITQMLHQQFLPQGGTGGWTRNYQYEALSDRLQFTNQAGDADGAPPRAPYLHDANGNMSRMPHLATIAWDHANRLQSTDLGGGGASFYTYDAGGARVRKIVQRPGGAIQERIYVGGGYEVFRQRTVASIDEERQTLHVLDGGNRVALVETRSVVAGTLATTPAPRQRYQINGHLQSSLIELDENASLISYEEYFPYGATAFHSVDGSLDVSAKRYRYTGKERDDETGLNYHGARYYAAWLGRWTATDPAGFPDGTNLYRYSSDSPVSLKDPNGTTPTSSELDQQIGAATRELQGAERSLAALEKSIVSKAVVVDQVSKAVKENPWYQGIKGWFRAREARSFIGYTKRTMASLEATRSEKIDAINALENRIADLEHQRAAAGVVEGKEDPLSFEEFQQSNERAARVESIKSVPADEGGTPSESPSGAEGPRTKLRLPPAEEAPRVRVDVEDKAALAETEAIAAEEAAAVSEEIGGKTVKAVAPAVALWAFQKLAQGNYDDAATLRNNYSGVPTPQQIARQRAAGWEFTGTVGKDGRPEWRYAPELLLRLRDTILFITNPFAPVRRSGRAENIQS